MFKKVRKNEISKDECKKLLKKAHRGVLAINGEDGYPYSFPMNYFYDGKRLIFHSAKFGQKIDLIKKNPKTSFCVIGNEEISEDGWSYNTSSVVLFGKIEFIEKDSLKQLKEFAMKYYPNEVMVDKEIQKAYKAVAMLSFKIEYMTGKRVNER